LLLGIGVSLGLGFVTLYLLIVQEILNLSLLSVSGLGPLFSWLESNFGYSLVLFTVTFMLYLYSLGQLKQRIDGGRPPEEVAQMEHLTDVWTGLFFGIGVIWTAIGMRAALLHALGNTGAGQEPDAFAMLQRLVEGGILTALSTTILGGAGGYLMRLVKTFYVGVRLSRFYDEQERYQGRKVEALLTEISSQGRRTAAATGTPSGSPGESS